VQPFDGLFSGYGLFLSSDSVLHWAVAMQSGFNVELTAPLSTARWTHVAGVVDARQGFAALSMTTGVQLPASRHARLLFQASLCCGYYYHYYYYYSSLSGSNPLTLSSSCRATRPRASQCVQPIISMQPLPSRLNPSTTGLQAALHQLPCSLHVAIAQ
jgi:hypothetical protein